MIKINPYNMRFQNDYLDHGCGGLSWEETFAIMGYKSYTYKDREHYLSEEEYVLFVLRYSA